MKPFILFLNKFLRGYPHRFYKSCSYVSIPKAILLIIAEILHLKFKLRISIHGNNILIRTATSDFDVAKACLGDEEYDYLTFGNPKIILDVGANIGASTRFFANSFPGSKIYALEPDAKNYRLLKRNTTSCKNVTPLQLALWIDNNPHNLNQRMTGTWGFTLCKVHSSSSRKTSAIVPCVTLPELMEQERIQYIDIMKMDIEGAEKEILEDSKDWIGKVGILTAELHDRINPGCELAFLKATESFSRFERHGEKLTAYAK